MSAAATFDTLKFAKRLKKAGVPEKHAEAKAEALAEVLEANLGELASKKDLIATKSDLEKALVLMKYDLLKWTISLLIAQTSVLVALKFFGS